MARADYHRSSRAQAFRDGARAGDSRHWRGYQSSFGAPTRARYNHNTANNTNNDTNNDTNNGRRNRNVNSEGAGPNRIQVPIVDDRFDYGRTFNGPSNNYGPIEVEGGIFGRIYTNADPIRMVNRPTHGRPEEALPSDAAADVIANDPC